MMIIIIKLSCLRKYDYINVYYIAWVSCNRMLAYVLLTFKQLLYIELDPVHSPRVIFNDI